jgi:hypothetical protein
MEVLQHRLEAGRHNPSIERKKRIIELLENVGTGSNVFD